jgi:patatin-like phospholipase/acyl hydrolase
MNKRIFLLVIGALLVPKTIFAIEDNLVEPKKYYMLSIDGGGIRGIIPARILQEIEQRTGQPIYKLFDFITGNSTGGLLALALTTPSNNGVRYKAKDILGMYQKRGKGIFPYSIWRNIKTGNGLWGAKYDRSNLDALLEELFDNEVLSNALTPVLVLSYSIKNSDAHLWNSDIAKTDIKRDFYLKDVASATSAAPTYFEPKKLQNVKRTKSCYEADGGIFANNPAIIAITDVRTRHPNINKKNLNLISIGTGKVALREPSELSNAGIFGWVMQAKLIDVMMATNCELSEWQSSVLSNSIRIQIELEQELGAMDNVSKENINKLLTVAENYININTDKIDKICNDLLKNLNKKGSPVLTGV